MKATRKLIPALAMLLVSAVMMSTASFAWFAMNKNVEATGMTIKAKSDNEFLVIKAGEQEAATMLTHIETTASTAGTTKELLPVTAARTLTYGNVAEVDSWKYATAASGNASAKSGDYTVCTDLTNYVASEQFTVGLNNASIDSVTNLKVKSVTLPTNTGISVVIVCDVDGEGGADGIALEYKEGVTPESNIIAASVKKTQAAVITVYYYIDGENAKVYSDNISNLQGAVVMTFGVD